MPRSAVPLVGRTAELATLRDALDAAAGGHATAVVVGGDAGVGKTRLLSEVNELAAERGLRTLIGHCVDLGDAPPPYLPFSEALGRLGAEAPEVLATVLAAHPAVERLLPGHVSPDVEDRIDRGALFAAVLAAVADLAADTQLVLFIEDVHWADQASRDLLGFLFTRLRAERVALIVSYRSDDLHRRHPLRPTLAEWSRLPLVERITLERLDTDDVRTLVRAVHGAPLPEDDLASIVSRADGNPFFAEELTTATEHYAGSQLPWQLADLLLVRLDQLSDDARQVVRVAAVAGRRVPHEILADVVGLPPDRLDAALREAFDAHLLQVTSSGRGYTFRHALLGEAVYDDLLPGERIRLHAAYAALVAARPERGAAELARHARASHDYPTAFGASVRAGDDAMTVAAPQEAMQHYEAALELLDRVPGADEPDVLVVKLVDAATAAGRAYRGQRLARQALDALPPDASDLSRARLLFALATAAIDGEFDDAPLRATTEALALIGDEPTTFRARLAALHARFHLMIGRDVDAEKWALEAIDVAQQAGTSLVTTDAQTTLTMLERRVKEPDDVALRLTTLVEDAARSGEVSTEIRTRYNLGSLRLEQGELAAAQQAYELAWRRAAEVGRPWMLFGTDARAAVARIQYQRGDWDGALRTADVTGESPTDLAAACLTASALQVHVGRGAADVLDRADALRPWWSRESLVAAACLAAIVETHARNGEADRTEVVIDEAVDFLGAIWQDPWFLGRIRLATLGVIALSAQADGAPERARAGLVGRGERLVADGHRSADAAITDQRPLGIEARAWLARLDAEFARLRWLGGVDTALSENEHVEAWQRAVTAFDYGNVPELARSRTRLAAVLRAAGRTTEAAEQADLARAVARDLRAEPLLAELRALGGGPAAREVGATGLDALTDREREVLALLVDARTNRQIAGQLYISEKTVSVHVSNILAKLEVRSRAEAAALARAAG